MSEENDKLDGYELASEFAKKSNSSLEGVIESIRLGNLQGRIIDDVWYVNIKGFASEEASAEADKDFMKSLKPVKVVKIDLSFGNILGLTFKVICASLLILMPIYFAIGVFLAL